MAIAAPQPRVVADIFGSTLTRNAVLVVGGATAVGLAAQIAFYLPWNPTVPITLQTLAVILTAGALGSVRGAAAMTLYALLGIAGVPWFAPSAEGVRATGTVALGMASMGYVVGFILAAFVVGRLAERGATRTFTRSLGLMVVGSVVIYAVGATWLKFRLGLPWFGESSAFSIGVRDFLVGDVLKILLAAGILPVTWKLMKRAGALE